MSEPPRISWQYVALAALAVGFVLGLWALSDGQPQYRTALLGLVVLAGNGAISHFLGRRVDKVGTQVNGRMSEMLRQIKESTQSLVKANQRIAELTAEAERVSTVSRETKPRTVSRETKPRAARKKTTGGS